MAYRVIITERAKRQLDLYVGYTLLKLKNKQAAKDILLDAKNTKKRLESLADNFMICDDPGLAEHCYRKISFKKHSFFMLYRIVDNKTVIVDAMYHEKQDVDSILR